MPRDILLVRLVVAHGGVDRASGAESRPPLTSQFIAPPQPTIAPPQPTLDRGLRLRFKLGNLELQDGLLLFQLAGDALGKRR